MKLKGDTSRMFQSLYKCQETSPTKLTYQETLHNNKNLNEPKLI